MYKIVGKPFAANGPLRFTVIPTTKYCPAILPNEIVALLSNEKKQRLLVFIAPERKNHRLIIISIPRFYTICYVIHKDSCLVTQLLQFLDFGTYCYFKTQTLIRCNSSISTPIDNNSLQMLLKLFWTLNYENASRPNTVSTVLPGFPLVLQRIWLLA